MGCDRSDRDDARTNPIRRSSSFSEAGRTGTPCLREFVPRFDGIGAVRAAKATRTRTRTARLEASSSAASHRARERIPPRSFPIAARETRPIAAEASQVPFPSKGPPCLRRAEARVLPLRASSSSFYASSRVCGNAPRRKDRERASTAQEGSRLDVEAPVPTPRPDPSDAIDRASRARSSSSARLRDVPKPSEGELVLAPISRRRRRARRRACGSSEGRRRRRRLSVRSARWIPRRAARETFLLPRVHRWPRCGTRRSDP